jgi:hypothetical protein
MTVQRSERFDADLERQFRWYLLETDLDPVDALALATRFAEAVEAALEALRRNPDSSSPICARPSAEAETEATH